MRELKFRAWSVTEKKMHDRVLAGPGDPCSCVWDDTRGWTNFDAACGTIMQTTGLRDRKGREIFEGDIVLLTLGQHRLEVRWSLLGFRFFNLARQDWHFLYAADLRRLEVIGNIYEQPELLKVEVEA